MATQSGADTPQMFRLNIEVGDLPAAAKLYEQIFAQPARMQPGNRAYFTCGAVALQVVGVASPRPVPKALYFTVADLDAAHARAKALKMDSDGMVHGVRGGDINVRPWGERSFYADDPWGNTFCFVEAGTVYTG
jgi:predicted enzyme related to lactoylglutathione lyase